MKSLRYSLLGLLLATGLSPRLSYAQTPAQPVHALPLEQLLKFTSLPADLPWAKMTVALLPPGWVYRGRVGATGEVYWTSPGSLSQQDQEAELEAASWLSVRPSQAPGEASDVLFKTRSARYFEPLRRELKRQKIEPLPVTCRECVAERFETASFTLTFYREMKGEYPFVAVLHQLPPPSRQAPAGALSTTAPVPAAILRDSSRQAPTITAPPAPRP